MRKGFTLAELLVAVAILFLILGGVVYFFSRVVSADVDTALSNRGRLSLFQGIEVINSDLRKAGYGVPSTFVPPVWWDPVNKALIIRYVDYTEPSCEGEIFGTNLKCSYIVIYYLKPLEDKLIRRYINLDGKPLSLVSSLDFSFLSYYGAVAPLFPEDIVAVDDFLVDIDSSTKKVSYKIVGKVNGKNFNVGDTIICRNWQ